MSNTEKTLVEQMQISDFEISQRMGLFNLSSDDLDLIVSQQVFIEFNIDIIVERFYKSQTQIEDIVLLIGDIDTLRRLHSAQRRYILDLFAGSYDESYVNNRLRIGMVHKRIGVEPKLYLSAICAIKEILIEFLSSNITEENNLYKTLKALDRLLYFDIALVFDTYIGNLVSEIELAKRRTEIYAKNLEEKVAIRTQQLEEQTRRDPLTNIFNQRELTDVLRKSLAQAQRHNSELSVIYIDVDSFKTVNDELGHLKGDEVLKNLAVALTNSIREIDSAFRYGGDEFCIVLPDCNAECALTVKQRIKSSFNNKHPYISLSMGIADTGPDNYLSGEELLKNADNSMYLSKRAHHAQAVDSIYAFGPDNFCHLNNASTN